MRRVRTIRYREIADALRERVVAGEFPAGRLLPSEAALSATYEASRVTIRRALELLRDEGLIDARQGFGWFVATAPIRQSLARLATLEDQLAASGIRPDRQILDFAFVTADDRTRALLGTSQVLRVRRLNLADGDPFAIVTVWCPAGLGQHLSRADVERSPFYELLPVRLGGASQTIGARRRLGRRRPTAGHPARVPGAALRARHPHRGRRARPRVDAPLPGLPHRVCRRHAAHGAVDRPDRVAPGRVRTVSRC